MSFSLADANNNDDEYGSECLLILCPACDVVIRRCMFVFHCEKECIHENIHCINRTLGCEEVLSRETIRTHLEEQCEFMLNESHCRYIIKDLCGCSRKPSKDVPFIPSHCLDHCFGCVNGNCNDEVCFVVECENKCGLRLHACKMKEHVSEMCSLSVVGCINKWCGCMVTMCRSQRGVHLAVCSCSVITCTVEWRRNVNGCKVYQRYMDDGGEELSHQLAQWLLALSDRTLDRSFIEAMCLRDELHLSLSLTDRASGGSSTSLNVFGYRIDATVKNLAERSFSLLGRPTIDICKKRFSDLAYFNNEAYTLQRYSSTKNLHDTSINDNDCKLIDDDSLYHELLESWKENSWRIENMSKSQTHNPGTFTFQCAQSVPRAEYHDHYVQHSDISCQMDGWIEMSCPYSLLGCKFKVMRLSPTNSRLVYHPLSNFYGIRYEINKLTNEPCYRGGSTSLLLQLPMEILIHICSFLDGCSLQHIATAHPRLLEAVKMLLNGYCIYLNWYRTKNNTWKFEPIPFLPITRGSSDAARKLVFTRNCVGAISAHMHQCLFKGPLSSAVDTLPYCLHTIPKGSNDVILPEFLRRTCHGR